jgi:hypothetical protein
MIEALCKDCDSWERERERENTAGLGPTLTVQMKRKNIHVNLHKYVMSQYWGLRYNLTRSDKLKIYEPWGLEIDGDDITITLRP